MASIFSTRFAEETGVTSGTTTLYTVPAASVVVVRDIRMLCESAGANVAGIQRVSGPFIAFFTSAAANTPFAWEGRQVFNTGDVLEVDIGSGTWQLAISGYLLAA